MGAPKLDKEVPRNELLSVDKIDTYAIAFSDKESRVHTTILGHIPATGAFFFYPVIDEHFVNGVPKWLERRILALNPEIRDIQEKAKKARKSRRGAKKNKAKESGVTVGEI